MKHLPIILIQCLLYSGLMAQVPQALKYQAVARDVNGDLLTNQNVSFRMSILQGSASGTAVYVEIHNSTTNDFGLVNLEIGNGTVVSGDFSAIDWGNNSHYIKIEMDPAGGTLYQPMGTSQLLSVPYALQSGNSPPDNDWTITGNNQYSGVTGNVGIGTATPGQKLTVVGRVRAANAADETEYAEIWHGGSHAFLNWAGDGNFDIRYNNTTLATVSQGNNRLYIPRPDGDYGADKSGIYGLRNGDWGAQSGGTSWAVDGIDAAIKGYSYFGNNYTAGIAGYSYLDYAKSAAVIGAKYDESVRAFLAYHDDSDQEWAGYFVGDVHVNGKAGVGTSSPDQQLSVIGAVRGSYDQAETEFVEMSHGGGSGYLNWNGDGNLEFRYNNTALASIIQTGGFNITAGNAYMIGGNSMLHNEGSNNLFAGYQAGLNNTGSASTFIGFQTGISGNAGNYNTFVGTKAGQQNLSGSSNAFIGNEAGQHNSTGGGNAFLGSAAGDGNTTGSDNVFVGYWAGGFNATGSSNTMIGCYAGVSNANQTGNVFIGHNAGRNEAGSNKLYIDNSNTSSPLIWGDFNTNQVKVNGSLFVTSLPFGDKQNVQWDNVTGQFYYDNSSMRYKENISSLDDDCSKLLTVSPKTYTRPNNPGVYEIGYIAEEFDAAGLNKLVWYDDEGNPEGVNYDKIILYTNENVKALKQENRLLKEALQQLDKRVKELELQSSH